MAFGYNFSSWKNHEGRTYRVVTCDGCGCLIHTGYRPTRSNEEDCMPDTPFSQIVGCTDLHNFRCAPCTDINSGFTAVSV